MDKLVRKIEIPLAKKIIEEAFVRLIPFKDHINIEAKTIITYKDELTDFKITPKWMLHVFVN